MSWKSLPSLTAEKSESDCHLHQSRRIHVGRTLADVGAGVTMTVIIYRGGEIVGVLWPFAGMVGIYLCLRVIGFVAACLRADEWEPHSVDESDREISV